MDDLIRSIKYGAGTGAFRTSGNERNDMERGGKPCLSVNATQNDRFDRHPCLKTKWTNSDKLTGDPNEQIRVEQRRYSKVISLLCRVSESGTKQRKSDTE